LNEKELSNLLRKCQDGDELAFGTLTGYFYENLLRTAYLITNDYEMVQDALQATLIKMWKYLPALRANGLKAWLMKVMINEVKHQYRHNRTRKITIEQLPEIFKESVEAVDVHSDEYDDVRRAIESLKPEQREILILKYFSGFTVPEIAATMNCREGTVKSRLSRAINQLAAILRDGDEQPEKQESLSWMKR
jgi:RNA polymerase sigma-70 factor (ECF subfamily)